MARIRTPKTLKELTCLLSDPDIFEYISTYKAIDHKGEYHHWDSFKWRIKAGHNEDKAWLATKLARKGIQKTVPTIYGKTETEKFSFCVPESLFSKLHKIDKLTGGGHSLSSNTFLSPQDKDKYLVNNLMMEEAITSSQLEGASTTRRVAKEMLQKERPPLDKSEQMIVNNYKLMKKVVERQDDQLSLKIILELHLVATDKAIDNNAVAGEFRKDNSVSVMNGDNEIAHTPPCYKELKQRLQDLCDFANDCHDGNGSNEFIHPIIKAVILHFMIGYIHPFGDGNGRTARAIFYWFMLRENYWLFEYVSISKLIQEKRSDYDKAYMHTETDELDLTYFLYNQVDVTLHAVQSLHDHIENKKQEYYQIMSWLEDSAVASTLKRPQVEVIKLAIKEPGRTFTAKELAGDFDITENTARTYLNKMVSLDLLFKSQEAGSKTQFYIAPSGLKERLK